jgi:hypothetical protein
VPALHPADLCHRSGLLNGSKLTGRAAGMYFFHQFPIAAYQSLWHSVPINCTRLLVQVESGGAIDQNPHLLYFPSGVVWKAERFVANPVPSEITLKILFQRPNMNSMRKIGRGTGESKKHPISDRYWTVCLAGVPGAPPPADGRRQSPSPSPPYSRRGQPAKGDAAKKSAGRFDPC